MAACLAWWITAPAPAQAEPGGEGVALGVHGGAGTEAGTLTGHVRPDVIAAAGVDLEIASGRYGLVLAVDAIARPPHRFEGARERTASIGVRWHGPRRGWLGLGAGVRRMTYRHDGVTVEARGVDLFRMEGGIDRWVIGPGRLGWYLSFTFGAYRGAEARASKHAEPPRTDVRLGMIETVTSAYLFGLRYTVGG